MDSGQLGAGEVGADPVGEVADGQDDGGELLPAVGVDPALVEGVGRAALEQVGAVCSSRSTAMAPAACWLNMATSSSAGALAPQTLSARA